MPGHHCLLRLQTDQRPTMHAKLSALELCSSRERGSESMKGMSRSSAESTKAKHKLHRGWRV
jgi:hypothetical protein